MAVTVLENVIDIALPKTRFYVMMVGHSWAAAFDTKVTFSLCEDCYHIISSKKYDHFSKVIGGSVSFREK